MRTTARTLSILWILVFAFTPQASPQATREGHTVSINGMEMYFETAGSGEPLVLLHGWSGTGHDYDPFIEEFAQHYQLIIPDLRGHGRSTNPSGEFTMHQAAQDILALMDYLGINQFRAIGASMGGITLLHLGVQQSSRMSYMIIVGAGNVFLDHCRETMIDAEPDSYPEEWWAQMRTRHQHGDDQIRAIAEMLPAFGYDRTDVDFSATQLGNIQTKTLIVYGDSDWCFPVSLAVEMYDAIPNSYLWVVPNGGHVPVTGEHENRFKETALRFLAGAWEER